MTFWWRLLSLAFMVEVLAAGVAAD